MRDMKCAICEKDLSGGNLIGHIKLEHDDYLEYLVVLQKRIEKLESNVEKSHGPISQDLEFFQFSQTFPFMIDAFAAMRYNQLLVKYSGINFFVDSTQTSK